MSGDGDVLHETLSADLLCLPEGWCWTTVADVSESIRYGSSAKTSGDAEVPVLRMGNIRDGKLDLADLRFLPENHSEFPALLLHPGDLLFNRTNSAELVGKTAVYRGSPSPCSYASYLIAVRMNRKCMPEYLSFYINSMFGRAWITSVVSQQVGQANVNGSKLAALIFPLAPLPEQHRMIEEIEKQFSRLDEAVADLKRVQANLKRYRASVLKAACEGRLVPTEAELTRKEGRDYEPADQLLKRIMEERRRKWEENELAKLRAKGKEPKDDGWKARYQAPAAPDMSDLSELQKGWCWVTLESLTLAIGDVDHKMPKPVDSGIPYISTKDFMGHYDIDFSNAKNISTEDYNNLCRKISPSDGDILLSRYGTVGEVRKVRHLKQFQASYSIAIIKTLSSAKANDFLDIALRSDIVQKQIKKYVRATAQPDLGLQHIRILLIPLAPFDEQLRIVAEVERRLSVVEQLEKVVDASLKRAEKLRQSILKRAFEGKLVPQDPNDELASVLLERISRIRNAEYGMAGTGRSEGKRKTLLLDRRFPFER